MYKCFVEWNGNREAHLRALLGSLVALLLLVGATDRTEAQIQEPLALKQDSLLIEACKNPEIDPRTVLGLLAQGANATIRDQAGMTALDYARNNERLRSSPAYSKLSAQAVDDSIDRAVEIMEFEKSDNNWDLIFSVSLSGFVVVVALLYSWKR